MCKAVIEKTAQEVVGVRHYQKISKWFDEKCINISINKIKAYMQLHDWQTKQTEDINSWEEMKKEFVQRKRKEVMWPHLQKLEDLNKKDEICNF